MVYVYLNATVKWVITPVMEPAVRLPKTNTTSSSLQVPSSSLQYCKVLSTGTQHGIIGR